MNKDYAIPMYDIVTNTRLWRIDGKEYITSNLIPKHPVKVGNRVINCAKISEVISHDNKRTN